jgi:hypothetical protein
MKVLEREFMISRSRVTVTAPFMTEPPHAIL